MTHALHLATSKETPGTIMDVAVKGLFWLLEACRASPAFRQFVLIGGDAELGSLLLVDDCTSGADRHSVTACHCGSGCVTVISRLGLTPAGGWAQWG